MAQMTSAQALVKILESEGVRHVFGIPGTAVLPIYKALKDTASIRHIIARHEEGSVHMADGYARATNTFGVCISTSGPAATNLVTGLYTAKADSIPLLAITGQHDQMGRESFQAVDIEAIVRPIVKKTYYVREAVMVPWVFREAIKVMKEARPGPVLVDLPVSVQKGLIDFDLNHNPPLPIFKIPPTPRQVDIALDMIQASKHPIMLLGGGVLLADAHEAFMAVAESLQLPVVTTYMGKSGISWNHPLMAGHVGTQCNTPEGNQAFLESDLVFAVGSRFNDRHTGDVSVYKGDRKVIHVDLCASQMGRNIMPELGIWADAKLTLQAMLVEIKRRGIARRPWIDIERRRTDRQRRSDFDCVPIKPQRVFHEMNDFFDEDTVFVTSIGLHQIWSAQLQKITKPRHYLCCGGAGTLGWDLPAVIGAKVNRPEKQFVSVVGDYGFQFCMQEFTTAVMYRLPFVCIVINNGYLGLIRQNQEYFYDMDYEIQIWYGDKSENQGRGFDFVKFAESCGGKGERVTEPGELKSAFQRGVDADIPYIIDVIVERDTNCPMGPALDAIDEFTTPRHPADKALQNPR